MTDTRLPEHFLTSPSLDALSDGAFRVFINALMWSVTHGTDGALTSRGLRILHPDGERDDLLKELIAADLVKSTTTGYSIPDFLKWQTPAEQVERAREFARERKRRERERNRADLSDSTGSRVTGGVTGRVTSDVTSEDRTGQAAVDVSSYVTRDKACEICDAPISALRAAQTSICMRCDLDAMNQHEDGKTS